MSLQNSEKRWRKVILASIILIAPLLTSCSAKRAITEKATTKVEVYETFRDTVVTIEPDSALIRAYLECRSGRVALTRLITYPGSRIVPSLTLANVNERETMLAFDCKEDSLKVELQLRDRMIKELVEKESTITLTEIKEKPLKWWQKGLMLCGVCFIALCFIGIIKILK